MPKAIVTRHHFHPVLRRFRHNAGLTQEQMAERMDVSVGFFGMMEVGKRWPNIDMLFRIASALDVRPWRVGIFLSSHSPFINP
ncbi:MAG TPA: transcriptional regulator [Desulfobulbaceae bacterium]|nr:transcriptional regulator [Desulfobulbaceae bacterium]